MAKKFDMNKMMRGKSLSDAADNIENMTEETAESLEDLLAEPRKDKVTKAVVAIRRDALLPDADKKTLIDALRAQFSGLFNLKNCPDDYESLKHESIFLSELTQVSFLLLGQRLMKIRDNELYRIDGYDDFKTFVTEEVKIARSTAYNYIDLVSVFGVQTFGRANAPDPSKLIPLLPLLKSKNENIPVDKIKSQFVKEAQNHSARDIKEKAQELKVKYGLAKAAAEKQKPEVDFKQLSRDYHFDLSKVKSDLEKIYREYEKLAQKHRILAEKLLKKKDKEKGLFERERARIYSEVSKKLGSHFVFLREILK